MAGTVQGPLTDLERAKYASDSDLTSSIVQTRQQGDITIDTSTPLDVSNAVYPVRPDSNVGYNVKLLEDSGGNTNMNIDGSVTPVVYSWSPDVAFGIVQVWQANLIVIGDNISDFFDYGNRTALANGTLIETGPTVSLFVYANLQDNKDFVQYSTDSSGASFAKQGNNTQDGQELVIRLDPPILADSTFTFQITIRDNLTSLDLQQSGISFRTLPP